MANHVTFNAHHPGEGGDPVYPMVWVPAFAGMTAVMLSLAACGSPPPREPVVGPEARKAVDAATEAYASCIEDRTRAAAPGNVPGTVVGIAVRDCEPGRMVLAERIMTFHKLGHPNFTVDQLRAVADASIKAIEPQIRADAVVAYVERSSSAPKAP